MAIETNDPAMAKAKYTKAKSSFFKRGVTFAIMSGICYGLYSAFLLVGEGSGIWNEFWALPLAATIIGYCLLCAVGSGLNDLMSGIWCLIIAAGKGKLMDFFRTLKTKPGVVMICCGLIGGPIASTAYIVGLMMAGPMVTPITALCAAIGAIFGRILFKQKLNARMICGIAICFFAACVIGGTSFSALKETSTLGCAIALIAAFGWGLEGCVAGYGTSMVDYEIGITIRQCTSGLSNLIVLVPILCIMVNAMADTTGVVGNMYAYVVGGAIFGGAILWFIISGFFANPAYSFWYKGNSMCGAALGMTCNALYSFWVPFFSWIILGLILGWDGYTLMPIQWFMAILEVFGIWLIAMNPLDVFKKKEA
ncbi:MAG: hypothetical protein RR233_00890 [Clostridiales bacterium]